MLVGYLADQPGAGGQTDRGVAAGRREKRTSGRRCKFPQPSKEGRP
jgi:hypothetical protein